MRCLAVALVLAITPSAFAELVSNGGFESPSISTSYVTLRHVEQPARQLDAQQR